MGFDQMMIFYEQFVVVSCSIRVGFRPFSNRWVRVAIALSPDGAIITDPIKFHENGLLVTKFLDVSTDPVAHVLPELNYQCDVMKYFNKSKKREAMLVPNLSGNVAANPAEQVYFMVSAWQTHPDGSNTTPVDFDVLLSYDAYFYEPRKVAPS